MSNTDLTNETKKAMGFVETTPRCANCKHQKEVDDNYVDRMWHKVCTYSNLCEFRVNENSSCAKFSPKPKVV
ncbi:hypothetical protein CBP51_16960 [Cellvibrio mixtus]|uniref:Uncharacterized protein n=1 Tax=Cellvibrio mixtus TaxID=39650 RepID=A0A266Q645_9GAMM|nr:hypothetical protein CBP51_16960 [Cellvibrio mixtus]